MTDYVVGSGGRYTISTGPSILFSTPGRDADSVLAEFIERAENLRPPEDDGEADIRWGKPSKFDVVDRGANAVSGIDYVLGGGGGSPEDPVPPEAEIEVYTEVQKGVSDHRIENPDDAEQYVIVRRRAWSVFQRASDGTFFRFDYNNEDLS